MQVHGLPGGLTVESQACREEAGGRESSCILPPPTPSSAPVGDGACGGLAWKALVQESRSERDPGSVHTGLAFHCLQPIASVQML